MGTTAQELNRIIQAKADIISSLEAKGATVPQDALIDDLPDIIDDLPSGGGGDTETLKDLIERDITSITIPSGTTKIGNNAFNGCSRLASVIIPNSVTFIDEAAFQNCSSLTTITIPSGVTSIANSMFYGCQNLASVTIPSSVTSIDRYAFNTCSALTSITIPDSVTAIGNYTFANSGLTSITIPSGVTSIGNYAFQNCHSLASVTVLATTPPTLSANVFANNASGRKIYVPAESVETYKNTAVWSTYAADIEAIPSE